MSTLINDNSNSTNDDRPPSAARLRHGLPTILSFALLAGIGWFGHHNGWKFVAFGRTHVAPAEPLTREVPSGHAPARWCAEHGVFECPVHQPDVVQVAGKPKLPQYDTVEAIKLLARPENDRRCPYVARHIGFASLEAFEKQGIEVDVVTERPMLETLRVSGEVAYDETQIAHLSARAPGTVFRIFKTLGDEVQTGDIIGLVDALQVGKAKAELATAIVQQQLRLRTLTSFRSAKGVLPERQVREAESAYEESQLAVITAQQSLVNLGFEPPDGLNKLGANELTQTLRCLGLPDDLCETLSAKRNLTMNLLPITAPQSGVIVAMDVVAGEVVQPEKTLLTVAGLNRMWLTLHVKQEDGRLVSKGQPVKFKADGSRSEVSGQVDWISPAVDELTRTLKVRAALSNTDRLLRANSFGSGWIVLRNEPKAITVPLDALQSDGKCQIVFVRDTNFLKTDGPKLFHPRQVRLGAKSSQYVELLAGVLPGEVVATKGSAALRAELLKSGGLNSSDQIPLTKVSVRGIWSKE